MPTITITERTFNNLRSRADAVGLSVDDYVNPILAQYAVEQASNGESEVLSGAAWQATFDAFTAEIREHAKTLPPNHRVDDSRESFYKEREDAQL